MLLVYVSLQGPAKRECGTSRKEDNGVGLVYLTRLVRIPGFLMEPNEGTWDSFLLAS